MSEDKSINVSLVPKFADKALENVLESPSKSVGETFSDIWYLVLGGPMRQMAEKKKLKYAKELEKYKIKIEQEISKIPTDKKSDADIQIIGPVLEVSKYCAEKKELRDMFAKLIASSMNTDRQDKVHPIFSDMIRRMTVFDAQLFMDIAGCENIKIEPTYDADKISFSLATLLQLGLIEKKSSDKKTERKSSLSDTILENILGIDFNKLYELALSIAKDVVVHKGSLYNVLKNDFMLSRLGKVFKEICL